MVERPIKKSERQTVAEPSDVTEEVREAEPSLIEGSQDSVIESPKERDTPRPFRGKDKTKGKGKGNKPEDDRSRPANPALMRGPRPTKPKLPVTKPQEVTEDSVTEADQETTAEG